MAKKNEKYILKKKSIKKQKPRNIPQRDPILCSLPLCLCLFKLHVSLFFQYTSKMKRKEYVSTNAILCS